jgi:hypothetical protein
MLADEFVEMGVTIDPDVRTRLTAEVWARGNREFERLQQEIGIDITHFKKPCIRSLGIGAAFTEMAVSSVPLTAEGLSAVTALGGLAVLMVSAFDSALDAGLQIPALFPLDGDIESAGGAQRKPSLIRSAVNLYFRRLAALPQTRPQVRRVVEKSIERMYAAELESVAGPKISRQSWYRKNALPIAILGIPAWMVADACPDEHFRRHLAWLCRLGEFFGWLDDCVDYDEDLANGHANRIDFRLQSMPQSRLVHTIAGQAKYILSQWDVVDPASPVRDYFAVIVWGWIDQRRVHALS